jgi:D-amino-acid dehydrogenase
MNEDVKSKSSVGVIGAGIQGLCISLCLVKKGFKVTLIDHEDPGKESASYGNAGHFSSYASVPFNRPDVFVDVPSMLFSSNGPVELNNIEGTSTNTSGLLNGTDA